MKQNQFTSYSYDECTDEEKLFERLELLKEEGKIDFEKDNDYIFKIKDIELSDDEIKEINELFEDLDVMSYDEYDEDFEEFDEYENFDDENEDIFYSARKKYKSNDDFDDDNF